MNMDMVPTILEYLGNGDISPYVTIAVLVILQIAGGWFTLRKAKATSQDTALEQALNRQSELDKVQADVMNDLRNDLDGLKKELSAVRKEQSEEKSRYSTLSSNYTQVLTENRKLQTLLKRRNEEYLELQKIHEEIVRHNQELASQLEGILTQKEKKADA